MDQPDSASRPEPINKAPIYDIVIVGAGAAGLSVAISSVRSGLALVRVIDSGSSVAFGDLIVDNQLDVGLGETVISVDTYEDDLIVTTDRLSYRTRACLIAERRLVRGFEPPVASAVTDKVTVDIVPDDVLELDVLVVGHSDHAVELAAQVAKAGGHVVLAAGGMDPNRLSPASDHVLRGLERERRLTVLYRASVEQIGEMAGLPMAYFGDRRTPDLQFDRVIFAGPRETVQPESMGISAAALATNGVWFVGDDADPGSARAESGGENFCDTIRPGWRIGADLAAGCFPEIPAVDPKASIVRRQKHTGAIDELRDEHYNATITQFEPTHSDLWVLRIKPDRPGPSHSPGQYASLGLGYWEPRIDDAVDVDLDSKWDKLVRRSYSISSRMFDSNGYLSSDTEGDELEFYIVLVQPTPENVPGLTPRLAMLRPGDRIYLGPKVAGRYTLGPVTNPDDTVILLSTGTGEAPHTAMAVELLGKGHVGPIVSVVSVRQWADLGYMEKQRRLSERYGNYHYLPMPTREADVAKRYIQDVVAGDVLLDEFGVDLEPERCHVFMCGNPLMIGIPEVNADGEEIFPEPTGVVEILSKRGFLRDRRDRAGNIHVEEYW